MSVSCPTADDAAFAPTTRWDWEKQDGREMSAENGSSKSSDDAGRPAADAHTLRAVRIYGGRREASVSVVRMPLTSSSGTGCSSARVVGAGETLEGFLDRELPLIPCLDVPPLVHVLVERLAPPASEGLWCEFGVGSGGTMRLVATGADDLVYGFDSFNGLPEAWRPQFDKGTFGRGGQPPVDLPDNVRLVVGMFDTALPTFLRRERPYERIALAHIDCDLYSSSRTVLHEIGARLLPGAVLVFDELVEYPGYEQHEVKALFEFLQASRRPFQWIGCCYGQTPLTRNPSADYESPDRQKVAIRIL